MYGCQCDIIQNSIRTVIAYKTNVYNTISFGLNKVFLMNKVIDAVTLLEHSL